MTKGLIGFLLPGAAFVVWLLMRRDRGELRRVPWMPVLGLFLLVVLPWHLAMWQIHGERFIREYIVEHHLQRFLGMAYRHDSPFWYYLAALPFAIVAVPFEAYARLPSSQHRWLLTCFSR